MATFKDLEDNLKSFMISEQSDAHNIRTANIQKYNNLKIWMDMSKYQQPHFFVRISISEAVFAMEDCLKLNGGLGYEERFVYKWFGRIGIKDKLKELWVTAQLERNDSVETEKDNPES
jgi:hypothetical protein